ncbi:hypothetical protein NTGHW29_140021 [Candidatus Nitrotoga sp. HW29]|nr:hypothetical protein NTGHW29_140021 [Candidatus Nitrotoga sp. HW29]
MEIDLTTLEKHGIYAINYFNP